MDGGNPGRPSRVSEFFPAKKRWCPSVDHLVSSKLDVLPLATKKGTLDSIGAPMESDQAVQQMFHILDAPSLKPRDGLENIDQGFDSKDACQKAEDEVAAADIKTAGKHKVELTNFANDFLSICCSDIITSVASPCTLSSQEQATNEKLDVDNTVDKLRHINVATLTTTNDVCDNDPTSKRPKFTCDGNLGKVGFHSPNELRNRMTFSEGQNVGVAVTTVCSKSTGVTTAKPPEVLIKAGAAEPTFESPTVSFSKGRVLSSGRSISTPRSKSTNRRKLRTPKGNAGTSLFSPGDEFWDEAICMVDGLMCNNVNSVSKLSAMNVDGGPASAPRVVSCNLPYDAKQQFLWRKDGGFLDCTNIRAYKASILEPEAKCTSLSDSALAPIGKDIYGVQDVSQCVSNDISPLPVRRFDFSNSPDKMDDHKIMKSAETPSGLPVENVVAVDLARSMPSRAELPPIDHACLIANQSEKDLERTFTQVVRDQAGKKVAERVTEAHVDLGKTEIATIMEQPKSFTVLEKSDSCIQKDVTVAVPLPTTGLAKAKSNLSDWLPGPILAVYARKGLKKLYPWQVDCLQLNGVLEGKNLIYCASTSAGKSLVAEILMLRKVITTGKKALLVLPYVSICSEKAEHLESLLEPFGKKVSSFFGSHGSSTLPKDTSIAVCTIEKANMLINKLLEERRLPELAVVVIDELHMVGDKDRGYLLELMLTKLRYAAGEGKDASDTTLENNANGADLQVIGMSATMPNAAAVARWLQAALYETKFRPVPLDEYIKVANFIYDRNMAIVRTVQKSADLAGKDPDHIVKLCDEVVQEGHSVLLFCSSRKACETSAKHVAKFLPVYEPTKIVATPGPESAAIALEELQKCPAGLDPVLSETIPKGVAYHHAGLTVEEREIVEACYRSGIVRILTATSTLAAGVNLPARRVIFRQPRIGKEFIDGTRYRQMAGRAGRAGIDTRGESILICKPEELKRMCLLLNEECQPLMSCLADGKNGMMRAILEVVGGGIVQSAIDVERYVKCTLLNSTQSFQEVVKSAQDSLRWLCYHKLMEWDQNTKVYSCTPLGKAAFGSSLSPEESLIVFEDLAKAREAFVLASDLHLVYQVTPIHVELEPDWDLYYKKFVELSSIDQAVGNRVGVMEPFLMRMAHGNPIVETRNQSIGRSPRRKQSFSPLIRKSGKYSPKILSAGQTLRVCKRFYVSLILAKLVQEVPLMDVCECFKVARGMVQALQETSGRFASMVSVFCEKLGWHDLEGLITKFQSRVCFGVRAEIVELAEIPYVKASRARALYKAGLRTPQAVAEASLSELAKFLFDSSSFVSQDGLKSDRHHRMQMGMARKIQNGARKLVIERAEAARVAAFSALRALGVEVPVSTSQSLADTKVLGNQQSEGLESPEIKNAHGELSIVLNRSDSVRKPPLKQNDANNGSLPSNHNGHIHLVAVKKFEDRSLISEYDRLNEGPVDVDGLPGGFNEFYASWKTVEIFFFDLHFTITHKETDNPVYDIKGIAICWVSSPVYYVCIDKTNLPGNADGESTAQDRWRTLTARFYDNELLKVTWNLKNQIMAFRYPFLSVETLRRASEITAKGFGLVAANPKFVELQGIHKMDYLIDLKIAAWLLWPDEESTETFSLEHEIKKRLPESLATKASIEGRWINQMARVAHNGCCRRVAQIRALHSVLWKKIVVEGLDRPLLLQEMPLVPLLAELEAFGITVDMAGCKEARQQLEIKIKELESTARDLAGVFFSLSVPAEVATVLYTHLKLPIPSGCSRKKHHPSTDKQALDALKGLHPIIEVIREYRTLSKVLHSTLGSILFKARPIIAREGSRAEGNHSISYRVKGRWLQTSTATGRLSMEEPNLQCVEHPMKFTIKQHSEDCANKNLPVECIVNARNLFLPSQDEWILLSADYSQIEVRLMAHFSEDAFLVELLSRPSGDLFKIISARWTGLPEADVTEEQRDLTKRLVYGILYGMGVNALADQLECSIPEAAEKFKRFKAAFPGVAKWLKEAVNECREKGYICTLAGRRRYLDKIKYGSLSERSKAERQAVNSICQGSAADLIKMAMKKLFPKGSLGKVEMSPNENERLLSASPMQGKFRLLLQIHDELVLEVEKSSLQETAAFLQTCMEDAAPLKVPLRVKLKYGPTWGTLQPWEGFDRP